MAARLWIAPEGCLSLVQDAWLPEPSSPLYASDSGVLTLAELSQLGCLMLLGEPCSGKSVAMQQAARQARGANPADAVVEVDLGSAETSGELRRMIFEQPDVQTHLAGSGQIHLFLDLWPTRWACTSRGHTHLNNEARGASAP